MCHNKQTWFPVLFATSAFILSLLGNVWCEYISFGEQTTGERQTFGIWYYTGAVMSQDTSGSDQMVKRCLLYPDYMAYDAKWKAAKAFSIMTPIIGGLAVIWIWFAQCFAMHGTLWKCIGQVFVLCSLFSGLTLLFLGSSACNNNMMISELEQLSGNLNFNDTCDMDWGAKCGIAATILWFIAGVSMCKIPPPTRAPRPPPETQTVTYTKTAQPDGTEVTTKNVVKGVAIPKEEP